jgi:cytochrome c2
MDSRIAVALLLSLAATASAAGDPAKGKAVFQQCSMCHNATTDQMKAGPSLKGLFKKDKLTSGQKPTEAAIRAKIDQGGLSMPKYKDVLTAKEKDDLVAYLKTI